MSDKTFSLSAKTMSEIARALRSGGRIGVDELHAIVKRAGLDMEGEPRITPHQLRYTFGALLLEAAVPVAVVARMIGHANEAITQSVYSHEIRRRESRERTRAGLQAAFGRRVPGTILERSGGETRVIEGVGEQAEVVAIPLAASK